MRYGTCQCREGDEGGCEGGICEFISKDVPKKCHSVPVDGLCFSDDDCRNKSCYLGAEGTKKRGRCTCRQCRRPGCGGCKDTQTCPESSDLKRRKCVDITVQPSLKPSNTPTYSNAPSKLLSGKPSNTPTESNVPSKLPSGKPSVIPSTQRTSKPSGIPSSQPTSSPITPFTVPLGGYCTKRFDCMSRSCVQKKCQCQVCDTSGCVSGCKPTEICRLRTNSANVCRERPVGLTSALGPPSDNKSTGPGGD